jgi:hypothetical protein
MSELHASPGPRIEEVVPTLETIGPDHPDQELRKKLLRIAALGEETDNLLTMCQQNQIYVEWIPSMENHFRLHLVKIGVITPDQYLDFQLDWLERFRAMMIGGVNQMQQAAQERELKDRLYVPGRGN